MLGFEGNENISVTLCSWKLTLLSPSSQQAQRWTHHAWARSQNKVRAAARPQPRPVLPEPSSSLLLLSTRLRSTASENRKNSYLDVFASLEYSQPPLSHAQEANPASRLFLQIKFYWDPVTLIPACVPMTLFTRDARASSHNRDPGTCKAENIPSPVLYRRSLQTPKQLAGKEVLKQI